MNYETKKYNFIGFYGSTEYGGFTLPKNSLDTIQDLEIKKRHKDKFSELGTAAWRAKKNVSTLFYKPLEFELNEIDQTQWGQAPYMYVGENETIPKNLVQKLLEKVITTHKSLLEVSPEKDKANIKSTIEKTQKTLSLYFSSDFVNQSKINYWAVLPLSYTLGRLDVWQKWKSLGIVNIMWKNLTENLGNKLLNFSSYEEYESEYRKIYPDTQADMVWNFIYEMKEGDVILVSRGHKTILGRGIIKSPAKIFDKSRINSTNQDILSDMLVHREVKWEEFTPEVAIPQEVGRKFSRSVKELDKSDYDKIFGGVSNLEKNLRQNHIPSSRLSFMAPPEPGKPIAPLSKLTKSFSERLIEQSPLKPSSINYKI